MKPHLPAIAAFAAASLLAGCAAEFGYGGPVAVGYDAYYDGYYGPFVDGYWAGNGFFYYLDGGGRRHRDTHNHFRHDPSTGYRPVQGHERPAGGRRGQR